MNRDLLVTANSTKLASKKQRLRAVTDRETDAVEILTLGPSNGKGI